MRITMMITLCLSMLFFKRVNSSVSSTLENQLASYEKVEHFRKFFVELNKVLDKIEPWLVMVIARNDDDLRAAEPVFEYHPHLICVKIENCVYPQEFYKGDIVTVIFVDSSNKTIDRNIKILAPNNGRVLFVFDLRQFDRDDMILFGREILRRQFQASFKFAHFNKTTIDIYNIGFSERCTLEMTLAVAWKIGIDLSKLEFWDHTSFNGNRYPVPVGMFVHSPKLFLKQEENGSLTITGGRSGYMIKEIANQLNFTIIPKTPSPENVRLTNSRTLATIHEISSGVVHFGIGGFRPENLSGKVTFSTSYDTECLTWGVPRIINKEISHIIWAEYQWKVWIGIGLVFVIGCVIEYFYENSIINILGNGERRNVDFASIVLDVLAINLGSPLMRTTIYTSGRIMFISFTFYAIVLTTGYKSSLASILSTGKTSPVVTDTEAIVKANLTVGGSKYYLDILKDQVNSSEHVSKLIERYVVINNASVGFERLKFERNFALLNRRSFFMHMKKHTVEARELITFDILEECILRYDAVMMFNKYSSIVKLINRDILQMLESGILAQLDTSFYIDDKILERRNLELSLRTHMRNKIFLIFMFYGYGIAISTLIFLLELLWPRIVKSIKTRKCRSRARRVM